jgi:glycosyltransferase involved in cell wall biosynthesis
MSASLSYALVTPARDEAQNLRRLARCLDAQVLAPGEWVIVDDGSTDGTADIARAIAEERPWVQVLSSPGTVERAERLEDGRRCGRDVVAFVAGVAALERTPDIVVKLDADVSIAADYFERLVGEFAADQSLGIAGGTCRERDGNGWRPYHVTRGHVRGAARAYRWACFAEVSPLEERIGWDGVDEIRARLRGWTTRSIPDLHFYHQRNPGARDGPREAWMHEGELAYYMGYRVSYMLLRALYRARREPAALAMIGAYFSALWKGESRCPDTAVRAYVRRGQRIRRLPARLREVRGRSGA